LKILDYFKKNKEKLPECRDLLILIGLIMTLKGIYAIYPPAMWITGGIFLIYLGWPKGR
jgi:hypothetical protein